MIYSCKYNQKEHALQVGRRNIRFNIFLLFIMGAILASIAAETYILVGLARSDLPGGIRAYYLGFGLTSSAGLSLCVTLIYLLAKQRTFYFKALKRQVIMTRGILRDRRHERAAYESLDFCEYRFSRYPLTGHVRLVFKDGTKYSIARHLSDIEVLETNNIMSQFGVPARWVRR